MSRPLHVLSVEDSPTDAKLILAELRRGGREVHFERVETAETMREALGRRGWDVILSDWSMPKFSAHSALSVLKESGLDIPFIIVSGTIGEETAVEAMRAGARDYLLKDRLGRLTAAIEREVGEHSERAARRQVEAALSESEGRLRKLDESGILGITISDVDGRVFDANDTYLKMVGYSREELARGELNWSKLTPPELLHLGVQAVEEIAAKGVATPWETETFRKDGGRTPILIGVAVLAYPNCIAFTADLTQRKQAEAGRARAEQALVRTEEQLRHAQKMEAVGRLAGGVAHDFNNLLSVILSYGDLILQDLPASDPLRADVDEIRMAATRAAGLTRQLLMFSRQEVMQPKVIDLQEVLGGLTRMLRRIVGEDVDLRLIAPATGGRVKADPGHIEQVILNLVVNARDAMPRGGKLTIETANVVLDEAWAKEHLPAPAGPQVMMAVTDTGVGMDAATQARIFEPFFTTKGVGKGTGLGLSTVFGIVRQSGGSVWVYSEPGVGTTFKVYLPRVDADADSPRVRASSGSLRGTETILLVEDEDQVRAIALSVLRRQGYQVLCARSPAEALALSEQHHGPIDLLVTDVVMPETSGPELARRLAEKHPATKVLYMSGYTDDSVVRHGVLEVGVAFVQKPFTPASLGAKVREVLDADG